MCTSIHSQPHIHGLPHTCMNTLTHKPHTYIHEEDEEEEEGENYRQNKRPGMQRPEKPCSESRIQPRCTEGPLVTLHIGWHHHNVQNANTMECSLTQLGLMVPRRSLKWTHLCFCEKCLESCQIFRYHPILQGWSENGKLLVCQLYSHSSAQLRSPQLSCPFLHTATLSLRSCMQLGKGKAQ